MFCMVLEAGFLLTNLREKNKQNKLLMTKILCYGMIKLKNVIIA